MTGPVVVQGDARALPLPDASVDLIVTSPPYWGLRSYTDNDAPLDGQIGAEPTPQAYLESLIDCTAEMVRVLKPTGSIFVNVGDKYSDRAGPEWVGSSDRLTSRPAKPRRSSSTGLAPRRSMLLLPERYRVACIDQLGLLVRQVLVWDKPNGMPESVTNRARRTHEDWVHLTRQERYYSDLDALRQPHSPATIRRAQPHRADVTGTRDAYQPGMSPQTIRRAQSMHARGALPTSVWRIPTQPLRLPAVFGRHPAPFPAEWPRRLILGWCPPAGVVLDPFGGAGTTAMVATALGRTGISVDLSAEYSQIARWRVTHSPHLARVAGAA